MCIAANKLRGIRAALAQDELSAQLSRTHNDANVLCLSADLLGHTLVQRAGAEGFHALLERLQAPGQAAHHRPGARGHGQKQQGHQRNHPHAFG
jgi:hypothetical protein